MTTKIGTFVVANYETPQDPELAFDTTPYCWIVQTQYISATDTACARMTADLAGFTGKPRYSVIYHDSWRNSVNHTEAALQFLREFILPGGKDAQLVSLANTTAGMLFVFV